MYVSVIAKKGVDLRGPLLLSMVAMTRGGTTLGVRGAACAALALLVAACADGTEPQPDFSAMAKLGPQGLGGADSSAWRLFDRSTSSGFAPGEGALTVA